MRTKHESNSRVENARAAYITGLQVTHILYNTGTCAVKTVHKRIAGRNYLFWQLFTVY